MRLFRSSILIAALAFLPVANYASSGGAPEANLSVQCSRASALVQVRIASKHKIGHLVIEVRDIAGRVLYHEEGKALTGELIRRLDKATLPKGTHSVTVVAKDFSLTQPFTVE